MMSLAHLILVGMCVYVQATTLHKRVTVVSLRQCELGLNGVLHEDDAEDIFIWKNLQYHATKPRMSYVITGITLFPCVIWNPSEFL
jgi:hypothetical protein